MSFVTRQAAHCDQCSHEWLVVGASTPTHCAKCKSRQWNKGAVANPDRALAKEAEAAPAVAVTMDYLRAICAGNLNAPFDSNTPIVEIPICGKTWWEEGEHYECLMDKGHRNPKHGIGGMVRRLDD